MDKRVEMVVVEKEEGSDDEGERARNASLYISVMCDAL
jgi:hypothetical protein